MNIEVKLFAYFRDNRFSKKMFELNPGTSVKDVINHLGIDLEEVGVTMLNGRHCTLEKILSENDSLGIFPMIGGG